MALFSLKYRLFGEQLFYELFRIAIVKRQEDYTTLCRLRRLTLVEFLQSRS
jgi:hypothetical protein